jgi:hypothetical protein
MECEKNLVMKCKYIIQINQHFLSLYLVIFKNAVLPVLFFTHIIQKMFILKFCPFKGNYIQVIKMFYYTFEYLLQ